MVSRTDLRRFLDGHRVAEARLRDAALRRLPALSVEAARLEYDGLWQVWERSRRLGDVEALDRLAIRDRVTLRRRLAGRR
ncbi:MAG: hypothetical protein HYV94_08555 [Candidatus Rokubacteria bacterium]|jgi:hypothetical protein|nr:hypothetical protein [Candidatus Rokubacteria bacterium]MBI2014455.1 hypothetical protein [Candidatus Rokubacteria bacterium]MBI2157764.1 hypothetical protein [Candidatus Rokubacteria bacterium]MBI2492131.1 hypothetical protein [Candidatus Rokubacteria bacterium]MBI4627629.1 hypothetical protein [Candidatus Rokubacteria bacterium]